MGVWKSLVDRMKDKRDELARKAAKKAASAALDSAGNAVTSAGKAIERALFGDDEKERGVDAPPAPPDPFARLKAAEAEKKEREREEKRKAREQKRVDGEIDAELAAMKKKLKK